MFRTRTSRLVSLFMVVLITLACQIPGFAPTTTAPTTAIPSDVPATLEPTPVPVYSEMFTTYSPNGKRVAKMVSEDGGNTWNLEVDGDIRDEDVAQVRPVWSADSQNLVLRSDEGIAFYDVTDISSNGPQFTYEVDIVGNPVMVSGQYSDSLWFVSTTGDIFHVTPDWKDQPEKFITQKEYHFIDVAVTTNGYYVAGTTDSGDTVVFETNGKFIRKYAGCANGVWSVGSHLACVNLEGSNSQIEIYDIANPGRETVIKTGNLRPGNLVFSSGGNKLLFYYVGAVYWVRLSDYLVFHVSDPNSSLAFNPSWHNGFIVYDECQDMVCVAKTTEPITTMKWLQR